jgi:hypothetical protein
MVIGRGALSRSTMGTNADEAAWLVGVLRDCLVEALSTPNQRKTNAATDFQKPGFFGWPKRNKDFRAGYRKSLCARALRKYG